MKTFLKSTPWRFTIAPMMDWTTRHQRYFARLLTQHARLYTEMVTTGALIHGDQPRHLDFFPQEHPVALQLGGSDPSDLARCAELGQRWGYDEINLNVGCPSDRVQSGRFGACLMKEPKLVSQCVKAMIAACDIPVTVKSRIGVDDQEDYHSLHDFVAMNAEAGCEVFIIHARKAWLEGLSPKENRDVPPLQYEIVYRIKQAFPDLTIVINGGITTLEECEAHLQQVDGVMLGREAYQNPYLLAEVDQRLFGADEPVPNRREIVEQLVPFVAQQRAEGVALKTIARHILGLYQNIPGAKRWRRHLSQHMHGENATEELLLAAADLVEEALQRRRA